MWLVTDIAIRSSIYVHISVTNVFVGIAPTGSRAYSYTGLLMRHFITKSNKKRRVFLIYLLIHNYYLCCLYETFSKKLVPKVFIVIQTVIHTYILSFISMQLLSL